MSMVPYVASKAAFDALLAEASSNDRVIFVDFTASWCGPCQQVAPVYAQLAAEFPQSTFVKVDVDDNEETTAECGIRAMPTFKAFAQMAEIGSLCGASAESLRDFVLRHSVARVVVEGHERCPEMGNSGRPTTFDAESERAKRLAALQRRGHVAAAAAPEPSHPDVVVPPAVMSPSVPSPAAGVGGSSIVSADGSVSASGSSSGVLRPDVAHAIARLDAKAQRKADAAAQAHAYPRRLSLTDSAPSAIGSDDPPPATTTTCATTCPPPTAAYFKIR